MSTEIPTKLRSKKTVDAAKELKNPYVIAGIVAVIAVAIYIYYKKKGGGGGGGESVSPIESGPVRTSMDMAVIPGARTG